MVRDKVPGYTELITDLLHKCPNEIRNREHLDPAAAFDEIAKVLFMKVCVERRLRRGKDRQNLFTADFLDEIGQFFIPREIVRFIEMGDPKIGETICDPHQRLRWFPHPLFRQSPRAPSPPKPTRNPKASAPRWTKRNSLPPGKPGCSGKPTIAAVSCSM